MTVTLAMASKRSAIDQALDKEPGLFGFLAFLFLALPSQGVHRKAVMRMVGRRGR